MTLDELYGILEIERPEDLEYFEQFADLMELNEGIPFDFFYIALSGMKAETAGELVENYFEELTGGVPDEENELVSIIDSVEQNLLMLAPDIANDDVRRSFVQQLYKFRGWYTNPEGAFVDGKPSSILDAVFAARETKLIEGEHKLDFSPSYNYELDDAAFGIGSYEKIDVAAGADEEKDE